VRASALAGIAAACRDYHSSRLWAVLGMNPGWPKSAYGPSRRGGDPAPALWRRRNAYRRLSGAAAVPA